MAGRAITIPVRSRMLDRSPRSSITLRLLDHAERNWPQLAKFRARYHGSFACITGVLRDGQQIPLFRLRYGGSVHSFGFVIYSAASDRHQDAVLRTGLPVRTPQEALDTARTVHLADLEPLDPRRTSGVTHLAMARRCAELLPLPGSGPPIEAPRAS
jgi:hypothetical protein